MKINLALLLLIPLALAACASSPQTKSPETVTAVQPQVQEKAADKGATGISAETPSDALAGQLQEMQKKSVYFDFDHYSIKPEYQGIIQQQAEFLKTNASSVTLEGNSDERGSAEYNLALGDKRAHAVRKSLEILGVKSNQINVVSFGEEKPRSNCHEEKCWSENRRVDFNEKAGN